MNAGQPARWVAPAGVGLALAIVLPVAFHQVGIGPVFLPMHIPILITGALWGPRAGVVTGVLAPALSYLTTGSPPMVPPVAPLMTVELATYGLVAGLARSTLAGRMGPRRRMLAFEYLWTIATLLSGRVMLGVAASLLGPMLGLRVAAMVYVKGAVLAGLPGIILQLVLIPPLVAWMSLLIVRQHTHP
jgi:hypothetical protein